MERLKVVPKYETRGISLIYVNPVVTFEQIILSVNNYVRDKYNFNPREKFDKALALNVGAAVSHLKDYFENYYVKGVSLNSFTHGKIEIELLSYALRPYEIKFIPTRTYTKEHILIFITLDEVGKISVNSKYNIDLLMKEVDKYLENYEYNGDKIIKKRRF